jgi:hypothetical protein
MSLMGRVLAFSLLAGTAGSHHQPDALLDTSIGSKARKFCVHPAQLASGGEDRI